MQIIREEKLDKIIKEKEFKWDFDIKEEGIYGLEITVSAKKGKWYNIFRKDDGDLKLIINGQIQKNQEPKSHKYWYWCGKVLKGSSKEFFKELNLKENLCYLEFWADRSPKIEEIKIGLGKISSFPKAKVIWEFTYLRQGDDTLFPILAKIERDQEVEVLEKAIEGEAPYIKERKDYCTLNYEISKN